MADDWGGVAGASAADPLGYEAAFGPLQMAAGTAQEQAAGSRAGRLAAVAQEDAPLSELWDAPSHALPPPRVLCELSLEAMLAGPAH